MNEQGQVIQKKVQNSVWKTKKEALLAERKFLDSPDNVTRKRDKIKYKDLYNEFIENKSKLIKKRSLMSYQEAHNYHILKYFGDIVVENITSDDIRRWQRKLINKGYSNTYLKTIQVNIRRVLTWRIKHDYIDKNPFKWNWSTFVEFQC